ncbi:MAG: hypothetical protein LBK65_07445 [Tannerellaceae bacterium]|jgi:hypothetical protein|nr:hypothetical protein [Tannerellaceae bacterium]
MRRIASHYIFWKQLYSMHYAELSDQGVLQGIHPLREEAPATEFYDGLMFPVPAGVILPSPYPVTAEQIRRSGITGNVSSGDRVHLYRIHGNSIVLVA